MSEPDCATGWRIRSGRVPGSGPTAGGRADRRVCLPKPLPVPNGVTTLALFRIVQADDCEGSDEI
jgi:hypothetical protein